MEMTPGIPGGEVHNPTKAKGVQFDERMPREESCNRE
jgi:hypothetical protein